MSVTQNIETMEQVFSAIEHRDLARLTELFAAAAEFHWPPSLPYAKNSRGVSGQDPTWAETWLPLQATEAEQKMDARVVAASGDEVVVLWRQRGVTAAGDRFDSPVLGLYVVQDGKLVRAQMFYFDPAAAARFLAKAMGGQPQSEGREG